MSTSIPGWKPDDSFHDVIDGEQLGVKRVKDAMAQIGFDPDQQRTLTSRDAEAKAMIEPLRRHTLPEGFEQWQLPIIVQPKEPTPWFSFMTVGRPGAVVPEHAHTTNAVMRLVLSGSLIHSDEDHEEEVELVSGDWVFIPVGKKYTMRAGHLGSVSAHWYLGDDTPDLR